MMVYLRVGVLVLFYFASSLSNSAENSYSLRLIGNYTIKTKTMFEGEEFGGISAIDQSPDGRFWALSDERGGGHGRPRFYSLTIDLDGEAIHQVTIDKLVYLKNEHGETLPMDKPTIDPEGLRVNANGNLYISSEGNWNKNISEMYQPLIAEFKTDGSFIRLIKTPAQFDYVDNTTSGGRNNKLFESIALAQNGTLFTANEDALIEDGQTSSTHSGSVVRIVKFDREGHNAIAEYAYQLPAIPFEHRKNEKYPAGNGLVELLALSETELIAVERAYADGVGNTIRLVKTFIESDTTDIKDLKSLLNASYKPLTRELLLEMAIEYQGIKIDNIEGVTFGPKLKNGNQTLILVSDNNFEETQTTQFLAFEVVK
jgi:hypothetical protein